MPHTNNKEVAIEEELDKLLIDLLNQYNLQNAYHRNLPGTPIKTVEGSKIREFLHQELQKARQSVLNELIEYYDYYGNEDELIQVPTLVKQLKGYLLTPASAQSELDQPTV